MITGIGKYSMILIEDMYMMNGWNLMDQFVPLEILGCIGG